MTFWKPPAPPPPTPSQPPAVNRPAEKGDRAVVPYMTPPAGAPERYGDPSRKPRKLSYREKAEGYTPKGCLFKVKRGWFDQNGYWCVPGDNRTVTVYRGAPHSINKILSDEQKRVLHNARQRARKKGVR